MTERNLNGKYDVGQIDYRTFAILLMVMALVLTALTTLLTQYALTHGYYEVNPIRNFAFSTIGYYLPYLIASVVIVGGTYVLIRFDETGRLSMVVNTILVAVFLFDFIHDTSLLAGFVV